MKCDKCGTELKGNESFCTKCGNPVLDRAKANEDNKLLEEARLLEEQKRQVEEEKRNLEIEEEKKIKEEKKLKNKAKMSLGLKVFILLLVVCSGILLGVIANKFLNADKEDKKEEVVPNENTNTEEIDPSKFIVCNLKGDFYNLDIKYEFDNNLLVSYEVKLSVDKENYDENMSKLDSVLANYLSTLEYDIGVNKDEEGITYKKEVDKNKYNYSFKVVRKDVKNNDVLDYYLDKYEYTDMDDFRIVVCGTDSDMTGMTCK